jgi:hypothetical protein
MHLQGTLQCDICSGEGSATCTAGEEHRDVAHAGIRKDIARWRHITSSPHHTSLLLLLLIVGPSGPSRVEYGDLAIEEEVSKEKKRKRREKSYW